MLEGLPRLPEESLAIYERPPLVLAICQIRFAHVLGVAQAAFVAPFQEAIASDYPIARPASGIQLEFGVEAGEPELRQKRQAQHWEFTDAEDNWKVVLAQGSLALETRAYGRRSHFIERLRRVLDALATHIRPTVLDRIGLRYINEIRPNTDVGWTSIIRQELLGPLAVPGLSECTAQSTQELMLRYPSNQGVSIRHGLLPDGTTVLPRHGSIQPQGPFYLLDFDAYQVFPHPPVTLVNTGMIIERVSGFNEKLYTLFRWAVCDQYLSTLGSRPR